EATALTSFHAGGSAGTPQQTATGGDGGAVGTTPMCALAARVGPRHARRQVSAHVRLWAGPTAVAVRRPAAYYCRRGTGQTRMLRLRDAPRGPPTWASAHDDKERGITESGERERAGGRGRIGRCERDGRRAGRGGTGARWRHRPVSAGAVDGRDGARRRRE